MPDLGQLKEFKEISDIYKDIDINKKRKVSLMIFTYKNKIKT